MKSSSIFTAAVLFGSAMAAVQEVGCYKSSTGTTFKDSSVFNSQGVCGRFCEGYGAFAMQAQKCYCGDMTPPDSDKVDVSSCNLLCPGYVDDECGGQGFFSFYNTGLISSLPEADKSEITSSAGSTPSATSSAQLSVTTSAQTSVTTSAQPLVTTSVQPSVSTKTNQTTTATSSSPLSIASGSSANSNVAGVAAGVVVGVIAIAVVMG